MRVVGSTLSSQARTSDTVQALACRAWSDLETAVDEALAAATSAGAADLSTARSVILGALTESAPVTMHEEQFTERMRARWTWRRHLPRGTQRAA